MKIRRREQRSPGMPGLTGLPNMPNMPNIIRRPGRKAEQSRSRRAIAGKQTGKKAGTEAGTEAGEPIAPSPGARSVRRFLTKPILTKPGLTRTCLSKPVLDAFFEARGWLRPRQQAQRLLRLSGTRFR